MRLENYNTKLIVQTDKDLLIKRRLPITIEDTKYDFIIFNVRNAELNISSFNFFQVLIKISFCSGVHS